MRDVKPVAHCTVDIIRTKSPQEKIITLVQVHLLIQPRIFYLHMNTVNNSLILPSLPVFVVEIFPIHWSVKLCDISEQIWTTSV